MTNFNCKVEAESPFRWGFGATVTETSTEKSLFSSFGEVSQGARLAFRLNRFAMIINAAAKVSVRIVHAGSSGTVGEDDGAGGVVGSGVGVALGLAVGLGNGVRLGEGVDCSGVGVGVGFGTGEGCGGFWIVTGFMSGWLSMPQIREPES